VKVRKIYPRVSMYDIVPREGRGFHNHPMPHFDEGMFIRGLSEEAKGIIKNMSRTGARPGAIVANIRANLPFEDINAQKVYNYRQQLRLVGFPMMDGSSQMEVVRRTIEEAKRHDYFVTCGPADEASELDLIFFAHPEGIKLLRAYHLVIGMDTTYKTNKYGWPMLEMIGMTPCNDNFLIAYALLSDETASSYRWALQKLRVLLGNSVNPEVIVTDREPGLLVVLEEVFPKVKHLLCTWHIKNNVTRFAWDNLQKDQGLTDTFSKHDWVAVMVAETVEEFERRWGNMKIRWRGFPKAIKFLETKLIPHKEKFVKAWTNKVRHVGNTTTCRVESGHRMVKQWIENSGCALDTLWHRIHNAWEEQVHKIRYINYLFSGSGIYCIYFPNAYKRFKLAGRSWKDHFKRQVLTHVVSPSNCWVDWFHITCWVYYTKSL